MRARAAFPDVTQKGILHPEMFSKFLCSLLKRMAPQRRHQPTQNVSPAEWRSRGRKSALDLHGRYLTMCGPSQFVTTRGSRCHALMLRFLLGSWGLS